MQWARMQPNAPVLSSAPARPSTRLESKRAHDSDEQCVPGIYPGLIMSHENNLSKVYNDSKI